MFPSFTAIASDDLLSGFSFDQSPADLKQNKANAIIERGAAIVIDVRTPEEYAQGHVVGAYNIPLDGLLDDEKLPLLKENDTPVLLYCRSGRRSGLAMYHMSNAGYKKVFNMGGVITQEYGLPSEPTQKSFEQAIKDIKPLDQSQASFDAYLKAKKSRSGHTTAAFLVPNQMARLQTQYPNATLLLAILECFAIASSSMFHKYGTRD